MGLNLGNIVNFDQLEKLAGVRRVIGLAGATGDLVEKLNEEVRDARSAMTAEDMDELRPLMARIVPAALDEGQALDEKLEKAKG